MKDEIKEILDKCTPFLFGDEVDKLTNYITNLQEENEKLIAKNLELETLCDTYEEEHNTKFNEWVFDKRENERLKNRNEFLEKVCVGFDDKYEIYKSRNEKAIEYNYKLQERYCHSALYDDLVASKIYEISEKNIKLLNGGDEE